MLFADPWDVHLWVLMAPSSVRIWGDQGEIQAGFSQTPLAHGASPQECLGILWAFSGASLKTAPKALPSVLAQYREKESNPLGRREMWLFQDFLSFPVLIHAHSSDGTLVLGFLAKSWAFLSSARQPLLSPLQDLQLCSSQGPRVMTQGMYGPFSQGSSESILLFLPSSSTKVQILPNKKKHPGAQQEGC